MLEFCPHNLTNDTACCSLPLKHKVKTRQRERVLWGRSGPSARVPARKKERKKQFYVRLHQNLYIYIYIDTHMSTSRGVRPNRRRMCPL